MAKEKTTKKLIAESFLELLSSKSVDKITVAEIVRGCGMTSPTFYNHFKDKYALIVWIYTTSANDIMGNLGKNGYTWGDMLLDYMRYFEKNRGFMINALKHASGRKEFLSLFEELGIENMERELRRRMNPGQEIPPLLRDLTKFYCYGSCRFIYSWLIEGVPSTPEEAAYICNEALPLSLRTYLLD